VFDSGSEIDFSFYAVLGGKLLATVGGKRQYHLADTPVQIKRTNKKNKKP